MKSHTEYLLFSTKKRREYINITGEVEEALQKSGVQEGFILVSAMHITAGVYVNDAEQGLIEDIGSDVITGALDKDVIDELISVSDRDSFNRARLISKTEGISCGGSSGTVACAMEKVAQSAQPDSFIVCIFADSGIRYLSKCYNDA